MAHTKDITQILDWTAQPAFSVENGMICQVNTPAACRMIEPQTPVADLISAGKEEYQAYDGGCLYLSLCIDGHSWDASVHTAGSAHIFILEHDEAQPELRAMSLAAKELRAPLADLMTAADRLLPAMRQDSPAIAEQSALMNNSLHRLQRLINNMADAVRYRTETVSRLETIDICAFLAEVFEKAAALTEPTGVTLEFTAPAESVLCLVDREKLERAVYNILSNSLKYTTAGGSIVAELTRRKKLLYLTVQDSGSGIPAQLRSTVYTRYLRQPGPEDGLQGIGLGMSLICSAARAHGGTVLIEHPENAGLRITLTLSIRQSKNTAVHSNILKVDYAGERDHALIELSEVLPASAFNSPDIN